MSSQESTKTDCLLAGETSRSDHTVLHIVDGILDAALHQEPLSLGDPQLRLRIGLEDKADTEGRMLTHGLRRDIDNAIKMALSTAFRQEVGCYSCRNADKDTTTIDRISDEATRKVTDAVRSYLEIITVHKSTSGADMSALMREEWFRLENVVDSAIRAMADFAAKCETSRMAKIDSLTGVRNRAGLEAGYTYLLRSHVNQMHRHADKDQPEAGVVFAYIDLDHFKEINDTHGHGAGDHALRLAIQAIRSKIREGDLLARLGGDEFAVVLDNVASPGDGKRKLDEILAAIQHVGAEPHAIFGGGGCNISASIGGGFMPNDQLQTLEKITKGADGLMYEVKRRGRGAVNMMIATTQGFTAMQSDGDNVIRLPGKRRGGEEAKKR